MDVTRMSIPDWGLLVVLLLASFSLFMTVATHVAVQRVNARAAISSRRGHLKRRRHDTPGGCACALLPPRIAATHVREGSS